MAERYSDIKKSSNILITYIQAKSKVEIPAEVLAQLCVKDGDEVLFVKKDSSWIITTRDRQLAEAQAYFKSLNPDNKSLVDELIADRRAEALKENE